MKKEERIEIESVPEEKNRITNILIIILIIFLLQHRIILRQVETRQILQIQTLLTYL